MKGTGGLKRLQASLAVKASLARRLIPLENKAEKYSATALVQLGLPLTGNLNIPMSTVSLRKAYQDSGLSDYELSRLQPVMLDVISCIKHSVGLGRGEAFIAYSSKVLSPFLWDVLVRWLRSCGFVVDEDIREVVLIEDAQNQGASRVKLMFGGKVSWGCYDLERLSAMEI